MLFLDKYMQLCINMADVPLLNIHQCSEDEEHAV